LYGAILGWYDAPIENTNAIVSILNCIVIKLSKVIEWMVWLIGSWCSCAQNWDYTIHYPLKVYSINCTIISQESIVYLKSNPPNFKIGQFGPYGSQVNCHIL